MKKYFSFSLLVATFLIISSCASAKQPDSSKSSGPVVLSFYSIGSGTPNDQPLIDFITSYRKKNKLPPISGTLYAGMGREGEHAYVLPLKELTTAQRKKFVSALSTALPTLKAKNENGGINLTENQPFDANRARTEPKAMTF